MEGTAGPVEIRVVAAGESGVVLPGKLSDKVAESLASYYAIPARERRKQFGPSDVAFLASKLGITPGFVRKHQRSPRVIAGIRRRLNEAAVLLMPDVLMAQAERAIVGKDTVAAKFVGEVAGVVRAGGVTVQQNMSFVSNQITASDTILEDRENMEWLKGLSRSGYLSRIEVQAEDVKILEEHGSPSDSNGDQPGTP